MQTSTAFTTLVGTAALAWGIHAPYLVGAAVLAVASGVAFMTVKQPTE